MSANLRGQRKAQTPCTNSYDCLPAPVVALHPQTHILDGILMTDYCLIVDADADVVPCLNSPCKAVRPFAVLTRGNDDRLLHNHNLICS